MGEFSQRERLRSLLSTLPGDPEESVEQQARWFLRVPVDMAIAISAVEVVFPEPSHCPNCDAVCDKRATPYCSERCKEMSSFVRQFRATLFTETIFLAEKQVAYGQIVWHLMGGGLPYRNSLIPARALARFFEKHDGKCSACGGAATTVDHIKTFCNRPINLRPMCDSCAVTRPFGDAAVMAQGAEVLKDVAQRIGNAVPIRCCDDQSTWDWRAHLKLRQSQNLPGGQ
ncbi:MAG: HNH endonuclease [Chthonomonas sp.]|nr:HNH endonuclease [Chthonomonas sp.]